MASHKGNNMNEPNRIFIRPKEGLLIRVPETDFPLLGSGQLVTRNSFWMRRLRDGDVYLDNPKTNQAETNPSETNQAATSKSKGQGTK